VHVARGHGAANRYAEEHVLAVLQRHSRGSLIWHSSGSGPHETAC
jgi:hypothetical protein